MKRPYHQVDIARLKEIVHPMDFYAAEGQEIKTKGASPWKLGGFCPFYNDRHIGSFYINETSGAYSCFSCNTAGGDIIAFIQMKYGLSFGEAIRKLARQWGVL